MALTHETTGPTVIGGAGVAAPRRRGDVLKRAIFAAVLDQLSSVGWTRLTMEGVATAAQTGKAALYRRWGSKHDLIVAALEDTLPLIREAPDHGGLREDLVNLLQRIRTVMYSPAGCALRAIMEEIEHEHARAFVTLIHRKVLEPGRQVSTEILRRGVARGEVRPDADIELLSDVGPAIMMYQGKFCGGEISEDYPARVVDQVLMPTLRP